MKVLIACLFLALGSVSCARMQIHQSALLSATEEVEKSNEVQTREVQMNRHLVLFGLISLERPLVLSEYCPQGWRQAEIYSNAWQTLAKILTLNLYSPWRVRIVCETSPHPN